MQFYQKLGSMVRTDNRKGWENMNRGIMMMNSYLNCEESRL